MKSNIKMTFCKNCEAQLQGNFCHNCGQSSSVKRITFKDTLADFSNTVFSVDAPLLYTITSLFKNPGRMLRDFLRGKRKTYYKPVAFFVLMTILYLVIRGLVGFDPLTESAVQIDSTDNELLAKAQLFMFTNINKLLFLFVFWLGLFLKCFFYKRFTISEYWTVAFYLGGVYIILVTVNMFFIQYINNKIQMGAIVVIGFYFLYAFVSFFQRPTWLVLLKTVPIYLLSFLFYILSAFGLSYLLVLLINL